MLSRFTTQVFGTNPVTVDKNGVLISKDSKESSLIDVIIDNKGTLPMTTPNAPTINRRVPAVARPAAAQTPPPTAAPTDKSADGVKLVPTKPGPPATGDTPNTPPPAQRPPGN